MTLVDRPPLAVLLYDDSLEADRVLAETARLLAGSGYRPGGVVQANTERPGRRNCDMHLTDLWGGEEVQISYDLGDESEACRLDTAAFAHACNLVEQSLAAGARMLIINRFGKQEAQGRGFRAVVAEALAADIPVVMGVSRLNLEACETFAGAPIVHLPPDPEAIAAWCLAAA